MCYKQLRKSLLIIPLERLYADDNFPLAIVPQLRQIQYDLLTSYEAGQANQGIPDDEHWYRLEIAFVIRN
ncbi:DUF5615 family PIN-like protein [Cronbergia sp. UHCC 0137]|uniref:DUF5615 family PIN-like protein n=1 Tax=Cronbergia sp. UHCC 0137 TaxID=3110239 RepID=UPI002B1F43F0|nr:DUF5615 family PIN-like protein [Cronbergia sp. UHCC 0137]MEA5616885.1 DUF5615 family PIN-like protein [Cronbergia sp. UHCC 0137]